LNTDNDYAFTELDSTTGPSVELELATHLGQHPSALEINEVITKVCVYAILPCVAVSRKTWRTNLFFTSEADNSRVIEVVRRLLQREQQVGNAASSVGG